MNKSHADFVRRPVFCKLTDLFHILDQAEPNDRHKALSIIYPIAFHSEVLRPPNHIKTHQEANLWAYDGFKAWMTELVLLSSKELAVFAVVGNILAWLATGCDESRLQEIISHNESDLRKLKTLHDEGRIRDDEFERQEAAIKERIENMPEQQKARRELYDWFCTEIVERIPRDAP